MTTATQAITELLTRIATSGATVDDVTALSVAVNQLAQHGNLEQAVIAVAEGHISTAVTALDAAGDDVTAAKDALTALAANLALIPDLNQNIQNTLAPIPSIVKKAIAEKTGNNFIVTVQPPTKLLGSTNDGSNGPRKPYHSAGFDDYDTGKYYCFFDYGGYNTNASYTACGAALVVLANDGTKTVYNAGNVQVGDASGSFGLVPLPDLSVRFFTCNVIVNSATPGILSIHEVNSLTDEQFSQGYDYGTFYITKSRELLLVSAGKLVTITETGAIVDNNTTFVDKAAFDAWAQAAGHAQLTYSYYNANGTTTMTYLSNSTDYFNSNIISISKPQYESHALFSAEHGYLSVGQLPVGMFNATAVAPYMRAASVDEYTRVLEQKAVFDVAPTVFNDAITGCITHLTQDNGYSSNPTQYTPCVLGFSRQHKAMITKVAGNVFAATTSRHPWAVAVTLGQ